MAEEKQLGRLEDVRSQLAFHFLNTDLFNKSTTNGEDKKYNASISEQIATLKRRMNQKGTSPNLRSRLAEQIKILEESQQKVTRQKKMSLKERITLLQQLQIILKSTLQQKKEQFSQSDSIDQHHSGRKKKRKKTLPEKIIRLLTQPSNHIGLFKRFECFPPFPQIPNLAHLAYGETFNEKVIKLCYEQYRYRLEKYIDLGYPLFKIKEKLDIDLKQFVGRKLPPNDGASEEYMRAIYKDNVNAIFQSIADSLTGYAQNYFETFQKLYLGEQGTLFYLENLICRLTSVLLLEEKLNNITTSRVMKPNSFVDQLCDYLMKLKTEQFSSWINSGQVLDNLECLGPDMFRQHHTNLSSLLNQVKVKYYLSEFENCPIRSSQRFFVPTGSAQCSIVDNPSETSSDQDVQRCSST